MAEPGLFLHSIFQGRRTAERDGELESIAFSFNTKCQTDWVEGRLLFDLGYLGDLYVLPGGLLRMPGLFLNETPCFW